MAKTGAEYAREWRAKNPERNKENRLNWNAKNREKINAKSKRLRATYPIREMLKSAKRTARLKGLQMELTEEWASRRIEPMVCEATGIRLIWEDHARRPSLDRLDPEVGYVESNVRITSWIFNRARGDFSDEQLLELVARPFVLKVEG